MPLFEILIATIGVGAASVALAALLSFRLFGALVNQMVSFSIGILLATTFLHLLPEAFESGTSVRDLLMTMLVGLFGFFFLEKIAVYRHSHHFEGDGHQHAHGHDAHEAGRGGVFVLVGSAVHNFSDGIVIAGAFLAGPWIGLAATLSIFAHEVPHKISDFIVLRHAGLAKHRAIAFAMAASLCIVTGGVAGYAFLEHMAKWIPFVLVVAAANFVYISLSDLVPQMQRATRAVDVLSQAALIAAGVGVVLILNGWVRVH